MIQKIVATNQEFLMIFFCITACSTPFNMKLNVLLFAVSLLFYDFNSARGSNLPDPKFIADVVKQKVCTLYSVFISFIIAVEMYQNSSPFWRKSLKPKQTLLTFTKSRLFEATLKLNA